LYSQLSRLIKIVLKIVFITVLNVRINCEYCCIAQSARVPLKAPFIEFTGHPLIRRTVKDVPLRARRNHRLDVMVSFSKDSEALQ